MSRPRAARRTNHGLNVYECGLSGCPGTLGKSHPQSQCPSRLGISGASKKTRRRGHLDKAWTAAVTSRPYLSRPAPRHDLIWHSIGSEGDPWPEWMRDTYKNACGVYAIKEHGKVVYVGSSRRRLYDTVTRHFQNWRRKKNFWKGMRGAHHDPGMVYRRGSCQIAVYTVACDNEREEEARLIKEYKPRDNLQVNPDGEELEPAPF